MKKIALTIIAAVAIGSAAPASSASHDDKKAQKRSKRQPAAVERADRTAVDIHVTFTKREVVVIREHYAPRYRKLPPGLRKKLARTGSLPPGWQKKMEPFPLVLERDLVVLPRGYRRGVLDGHAVIYRPDTQTIIDVAVLF